MRRALAIATTIATVFTSAVFFTAGSAVCRSIRRRLVPAADVRIHQPLQHQHRQRLLRRLPVRPVRPGDRWAVPAIRTRPAPAEQDYRALILYRNRGWEPWTCATLVGLSEDSDARIRGRPAGRRQPELGQRGERGLRRPAPSVGRARLAGSAVPRRRLVRGPEGLAEADGHPRLRPGRHRLLRAQDQGRGARSAGEGRAERRRLHRAEDLGGRLETAVRRPPRRRPAAPAPTCRRPTSPAVSARPTAPAWPGKQFVQGDTDRDLQCFQKQLGSRGYGLTGTGYYGPATKAAVVAPPDSATGSTRPASWGR